MDNKPSFDFLKKLFNSSGDEIFLCDLDGNIQYKNITAQELYPKIKNINKLSHLFNFEICILKSEDIITYTPLAAALYAKEPFFASINKQISNSFFADYTISSIGFDNNSKLIILQNNSNKELFDKYEKLQNSNLWCRRHWRSLGGSGIASLVWSQN